MVTTRRDFLKGLFAVGATAAAAVVIEKPKFFFDMGARSGDYSALSFGGIPIRVTDRLTAQEIYERRQEKLDALEPVIEELRREVETGMFYGAFSKLPSFQYRPVIYVNRQTADVLKHRL